MTARTRTILKSYFVTGAKPTAAQFADTVDSFLSLSDTAAQTIASDLTMTGDLTVPAIVGLVDLTMTGDLTINTDKFTVDSATGNTLVAGVLTVPTPTKGTDTTQAASTAFVKAAVVPAVTTYTSGSGTYTVPSGTNYLHIRVVGGGGGGGGSGSASQGTGGTGGTTTVTGVAQGLGGTGGVGAFVNYNAGGIGGVASLGTINIDGSSGQNTFGADGYATTSGGNGGSSAFGGSGKGGLINSVGGAATTNSGSGGGGAAGNATTTVSGAGGGAGGYSESWVTSPAASYTYTVGAAGTAGGAGTSGSAGGVGGAGLIIIEAF